MIIAAFILIFIAGLVAYPIVAGFTSRMSEFKETKRMLKERDEKEKARIDHEKYVASLQSRDSLWMTGTCASMAAGSIDNTVGYAMGAWTEVQRAKSGRVYEHRARQIEDRRRAEEVRRRQQQVQYMGTGFASLCSDVSCIASDTVQIESDISFGLPRD